MTDKYAKLRKDVPQAIEEAKAEGGINHRAQMIADLLADYDRLRDALRWAAGTLQSACCLAGPIYESSPFKLGDETRTVAQICDAADAALAQEQGGSDGN